MVPIVGSGSPGVKRIVRRISPLHLTIEILWSHAVPVLAVVAVELVVEILAEVGIHLVTEPFSKAEISHRSVV